MSDLFQRCDRRGAIAGEWGRHPFLFNGMDDRLHVPKYDGAAFGMGSRRSAFVQSKGRWILRFRANAEAGPPLRGSIRLTCYVRVTEQKED